jgi:hypothetical protein
MLSRFATRPTRRLLRPVFSADDRHEVTRAELTAKGVNYLLPKGFHGNPVSSDGFLVFTDFGWDMID